MLAAPSALAGSVTVQQQSSVPLIGAWQLSMPNSHTVVSHSKEMMRTVDLPRDGKYLLNVTPPEGATTFLTLSNESNRLVEQSGTSLSAVLDANADYRITVRYVFNATITVNSEPQGAPFELTGPPKGIKLTGVTPAVFKNLPPYYYTANYGVVPGCLEPKPQKREVSARQHITFNAEYVCDIPAQVVPTGSDPYVEVDNPNGKVSVVLTPHQVETLPGESITYTLAVKNHGKRTQHDLNVSFQYDVNAMNIERTLPREGTVIGNVAQWTVPKLYAGQTWKVDFPVTVRKQTGEGVRIGTSARVSGSEINVVVSDKLSADVTVGTAVIPRTGERSDLAVLIASMTAALILTRMKRHRRQQV